MNANTSHILKRTICALLFGVFLILLSATDASAHRVEHRPYLVYDYHVHTGARYFPRWLRKNREFQHWYWHSRYRVNRHMSWHRLYDIYRHERRHLRRSQKFYGKVYRDTGHRHYYWKLKKRRH